jgi:hypothetical protein
MRRKKSHAVYQGNKSNGKLETKGKGGKRKKKKSKKSKVSEKLKKTYRKCRLDALHEGLKYTLLLFASGFRVS